MGSAGGAAFRRLGGLPGGLLGIVIAATPAAAQHGEAAGDTVSSVFHLDAVNVTATRDSLRVFETPFPVSVVGARAVEERIPRTPADLLGALPGLQIEGVGASQTRPVIRGLRGQRVLLLQDGLRLNNARRRVDSGEPPALAGAWSLERIEVQRGPASVLYGSDAVGGVVNLVPRDPPSPRDGSDRVRGRIAVHGATAGDRVGVDAAAEGTAGPVGWRVSANRRLAGAYRAPDGAYGDITLDAEVPVRGTGVDEWSGKLGAVYRFAGGRMSIRHHRYRAEDAGFGYVPPSALDPGGATVDLSFPEQSFRRWTLRFRGRPDFVLADRLDAAVYSQANEREFVTRISAPMGPDAPPDARVDIVRENVTDVASRGLRLEATKLVGERVALTYGAELHRDRSTGRDTSTTTVRGLGPPRVSGDGRSAVPAASLRSAGVFAQLMSPLDDVTVLTVGARYQDVRARVETGGGGGGEPGVEAGPGGTTDDVAEGTLVGTASLLRRVGRRVALVASVSRGFRAPNLVERFYAGPTPEGRGYWIRNPELGAETSVNVDVGFRYRGARAWLEAFAFRNVLADGIHLAATGDTVEGIVALTNVNVDELRLRGVEVSGGWAPGLGLSVEAALTLLDSTLRGEPDGPAPERRGTRGTAGVRWEDPGTGLRIEYGVRWSAGRRDRLLEETPLGPRIPGHVVHDLRAGVRVRDGHRLSVSVENVGDVLYATAPNVGFFRPEPGRSLRVSWISEF